MSVLSERIASAVLTAYNDVLCWRCMGKENEPLTIKDVHEVLLPAMEKVFATRRDLEAFEQRAMEVFASKQDLQDFVTRGQFTDFKDIVLSNQDKMLKNLETLVTEKVMGDHQKKKERQLWAILIDAMREHEILSPQQLKEIDKLEIF